FHRRLISGADTLTPGEIAAPGHYWISVGGVPWTRARSSGRSMPVMTRWSRPKRGRTPWTALPRSLDAVGCMFRGLTVNGILDLPTSPGLSHYMEDYVRDGWWQEDFRAARAGALLAAGKSILVDDDIVGRDDRRRIPLLNEL